MKKIFGFIAMAIIFVGALTFTGCQKNQIEYQRITSKDDLLSLPKEQIVSITKNYVEEETNLKGTLYVVRISPEKTQEFFVLDDNQTLSKRWILYHRGSLTYFNDFSTGETWYDCQGDGAVQCYVLFNRIHFL